MQKPYLDLSRHWEFIRGQNLSKMRKLMLLIFVLLVHESTQQYYNNSESQVSPHCGDCASISTAKYKKTGHICHQVDKQKIVKNNKPGYNPYKNCVPDRYAFESPIKQYCCFRSPELGCSMLVGEEYYKVYESRCTKCKQLCEEIENHAGSTYHVNLTTIPLTLLFLFLALNKILVPLN